MRLGQTSIVYFISKVIGSILGFIATIYIARVAGEVVLGQYSLVLALVTWLGIGGKVGFSQAITKRISEGNEPEKFAGAGLLIMCVMISSMSLLVYVFRDYINQYIGVPVSDFVILLLFVTLFKSFINANLQGSHLVHVYAILSTGKQIIRAVIQILLVGLGFGLTGMLLGYATGYILTSLVGLFILGVSISIPKRKHLLSLFNYAKYAWMGSIRGRTFNTLDIAILGLFVPAGTVGIYSVAWSIGTFLNIFGEAISKTLFPEISKNSSQDDQRSVAKLSEASLAYGGLILIPGVIGSVVIGDLILLMFGDNFVSGFEVLTILVLALLIYTYNKQLVNSLNAVDHPDLAFRANCIFIISSVFFNLVMISTLGWIGAAVATLLSAGIGLLVSYYYLNSIINIEIPSSEIFRQLLAAMTMGIVVYLVRMISETTLVGNYNLMLVLLLGGTGAIVYFSLLIGISNRFRTTVFSNIPNI
ncbi:oligosaccharide flippase family protein [Natronorubrum sp. A-ect3]|uniref:oligosaccharide flippase family protein n=1 Tax=Natronorubrum sp. A-ect3 TaxID=3242698 RepID=UPI00359E6620